jgi:hypothetical protein
MENQVLDPSSPGSIDTFQKRALSLLSQWGFNKEAMLFLIDKSADPIEQLEFLETCLITLSMCARQYTPEPKSYSASGIAIMNKDVEEECRTMRTELRTIRKRITCSLYNVPHQAG